MYKLLNLSYFNALLSPKGALVSIVLFSVLLYANTFNHAYALDDAIVIKENQFTKQGLSGLSGIFSKDTFYGFFKKEGKDKLVAGGRYRPMSLAFFAVGWSIWGDNPNLFHVFNALFYGICGYLIFYLFRSLQKTSSLLNGWFPYILAILFISNPIHTEVVANIKGLDELFSLGGSLIACIYLVKLQTDKKLMYHLLVFIAFLFALLSKENAITFTVVAPLTLHLLHNIKWKQALKSSWSLWLATGMFICLRTAVLGFDFGGSPMELMNNPFLKIENNQFVHFSFLERMASIFYSLGYYLKLFLIPYPLTHDYYPRFVGMKSFGDITVMLSFILHLILGIIAILKRKQRPVLSYGILFYILTLSIVSNIVFPVGTNMAERFLFMPSLGIMLLLTYGIDYIPISQKGKLSIAVLITIIYAALTVQRNPVWKNDFTLFTTDVKTSYNSAKANNAAGGALQHEAIKLKDGPKKQDMLLQSVGYLKQAVDIHPNYKNAYLLLGNGYFYLKDFQKAIQYYELALRIDPNYQDARKNLSISLREFGKIQGEKNNDIPSAINYLQRAFEINNNDPETIRLLGVAHGLRQDHNTAVIYFEKLASIVPDSAFAYVTLFKAYKNTGQEEKATAAYKKAIDLDADAFRK